MGRRLLAHYDFALVTPAEKDRKLDAIFERRMDEAQFGVLFTDDTVCAGRVRAFSGKVATGFP
jgi:hypothetical protein